PVVIDNPIPSGVNGLNAVALALDYDRLVFTVSPTDVQLGSVTTGWSAPQTTVNQGAGQMGISLSTASPVTSPLSGSLVLITFHINAFAPLGATALNLAATNVPAGGTVTTKLETQGGGQLALRPAV